MVVAPLMVTKFEIIVGLCGYCDLVSPIVRRNILLNNSLYQILRGFYELEGFCHSKGFCDSQ